VVNRQLLSLGHVKRVMVVVVCMIILSVTAKATDTCKLGIFINSLYDFNIRDKSYAANFWIWRQYKNDSLSFEKNTEIVNAKGAKTNHFTHYQGSTYANWTNERVEAVLKQSWSVGHFPFDKQELLIEIEDSRYDTSAVLFVADTLDSRLDSGVVLSDFNITDFSIYNRLHTYNSTFGNPDLKNQSTYSRIVAKISIERKNSWRLFALLLTGLFIAMAIAMSTFFISPKYFAPRISLCVGAMFSAVGSKYVTESIVPPGNSFTLIGNLHNLTFFYIFLITLTSIRSVIKFDKSALPHKGWNDRKIFWLLLISYLFAVVLLVL
jgi:hypothetical protein